MKHLFLFAVLTAVAMFTGCSPSVKLIGQVNMISNRNVDPNLDYTLLRTYAGGAKLKKSRNTTIDEAIDKTVRETPGGEFLMNAKIYRIGDSYFAVEGDVWGKDANATVGYMGFKVGDRVMWKKREAMTTVTLIGTVNAIKDSQYCYVKKETGDVIEIEIGKLTKVE